MCIVLRVISARMPVGRAPPPIFGDILLNNDVRCLSVNAFRQIPKKNKQRVCSCYNIKWKLYSKDNHWPRVSAMRLTTLGTQGIREHLITFNNKQGLGLETRKLWSLSWSRTVWSRSRDQRRGPRPRPQFTLQM